MKTIIYENERGFLIKKGKIARVLSAGKYRTFGDDHIITLKVENEITSDAFSAEALLRNEAVTPYVESINVSDGCYCLHFTDGKYTDILLPGTYLFWKDAGQHTFREIDISAPEIKDIPEYIIAKLPKQLYMRIDIEEYQRGVLYFDKRFIRLLEPGIYRFWKGNINVECDPIDIRPNFLEVSGQEMLTADKVTLRVNFVCSYRITDYIRSSLEVADATRQLYLACQLALREFVGAMKLDELLENKDKMKEFVLSRLREKKDELYLEVTEAGVKDIILPGEIRDIMNTVLMAEKKAQANVIARREEVASTRSLLNTARLMDENKTLYKLKELEYIERICENVGNINIGDGDVLSRLTRILTRE